MALNLAPSSSTLGSTYDYPNLFDVLVSVASDKFVNMISNPSPEKKVINNSKRQVKKTSATTFMTFEDVRSLPIKSLIDKFSEMTSDEINKKYFYKCLLLPHVCNMTFNSFGNEKKALDKMKSHLLSHVQQLSSEYESNKKFSTVFVPKSPTSASKSADKKPAKRQILNNHSSLADSHKSVKKVKSTAFSTKKVRKKIRDLNMKSVVGLKKCYSKTEMKMANSVYAKRINHEVLAYEHRRENYLSKAIKIPEEAIAVCDKEKHNAYCSCLHCTFLSPTYIKEEVDDESAPEQELCYDEICYEKMESSSDPIARMSCEKPSVYMREHDYAISNETKSRNHLSDDENIPIVNVKLPSDNENTAPWYVIRTPPFPYIHTPVMFYVSKILEVGMKGVYSYDKSGFSDSVEFLNEEHKFKCEEEFQSGELISDHGEKYLSAVYCKMNCSNATVLECVENRVNIKPSNACVPKSDASVSENDENSENMQRVEKELALKYIAKLHAKKKKRIPDSLFCQICPGKHFTAQATLIHHYRSHAGIKPYACKICSATFTRQHSLNYHMLIHQNRSRFTCDFCGRTFRHPSHYKEHLRRHTGETPYHCTDCNLHFKTRNTFKRHLKTRHGKLLTAAGIETMSDEQFTKYVPKTKLGKQ